MELNYETRCDCHPETCCCNGKSWNVKRWKEYDNGHKESVEL